MVRVSKEHRVLYVFHPLHLRSTVKRAFSPFGLPTLLRAVSPSLWTLTPVILPFDRFFAATSVSVALSALQVLTALKRLRVSRYVLWFYDPEGVHYLDILRPVLSCYDCVDNFSEMPYYSTERRKRRLRLLEQELCRRCDLVFTTSAPLFEEKAQFNPRTILVENVADFVHFTQVSRRSLPRPDDFPGREGPVVGFVGALDEYKIDFNLVRFLARKRPAWNIVMIGEPRAAAKRSCLPAEPNIFYLGHRPYRDLPNYIAQFDVCMIPYDVNEYTKHVFPLKFFEFLATGKPVVASGLPSLLQYRQFCAVTSSPETFLAELERAVLQDQDSDRAERIKLASEHTWEGRKTQLLQHVYCALSERAAR